MSMQSQILLEKLMAGHILSAEEFDAFISQQVPEDLHLDYKHGKELEKSNASGTIRQYMSGFANSAGGILIIGVDQQNWQVTDCKAPGGSDIAEWAARCLNDIAHHFSPQPRFQVLIHPQGKVLIAATERSFSLIPCVEKGSIVYYIRLHDQTLKAPEYLLSDIILGRRNHSDLRIKEIYITDLRLEHSTSHEKASVMFNFGVIIENSSLSWAIDSSIAIICWQNNKSGGNRIISNHLLSYIECENIDNNNFLQDYSISHQSIYFADLKSFDVRIIEPMSEHSVPAKHSTYKWVNYVWKAAIYINSRESPPIWYQVEIPIDDTIFHLASEQSPRKRGGELITVTRNTNRPIVSLSNLRYYDAK